MFELHITEKTINTGTLQVSWCVDQQTLDLLKELNSIEPAVVFCITSKNSIADGLRQKEYRKVVPLKDLVGYLELRSSGENYIFAFIYPDIKKAKEKFLSRDSYKTHNQSIIDYCDENFVRKDRLVVENLIDVETNKEKSEANLLFAERLTIDVPKGCFAKEPSQWEKDWVNHLFKNKCVDQCDFRKRRIFAYTLQVLFFIVNYIPRVLWLFICLLFGSRNITLKYLLHPLTYRIEDFNNLLSDGTYFYGEGKNEILNGIRLFLMPMILFPLIVCSRFGLIWLLLLFVFVISAGITLTFLTSNNALYAKKLINFYNNVVDRIFPPVTEAWYLDNEESNLIICGDNKPKTFSQLPMKNKTIRLRFQDLKSKVCRPFSE
jgi:hypothetical protein